MLSGKYDIIVLDEINTAHFFHLITLKEILQFVKDKPDGVELVFTGRYAPPELIAVADLVTEMLEVKHYYKNGTPSRKASRIDYLRLLKEAVMDIAFRDKFLTLWKKYFNHAELPITFYYTDVITGAQPAGNESLPRCIIGALANIRDGKSLYFDTASLKCGQRFLGFSSEIRPAFRYFLSCGIPGKIRGERYAKSP